jgi:pyoverdine/dityrosine biosynthesis protein Dit1/alpha-ketoglutarate-dependent taurine dioxygenase
MPESNNHPMNTINAIASLVERYLVKDQEDQFATRGRAVLLEQIAHFTDAQQPLAFILPGFPCKSANDTVKTFGVLPDYGEVMAIERLDSFCMQINELYAPGSELTILSDGTTFSDIVHVEEATKNEYKDGLRHLTLTENISWADLTDILADQLRKPVEGGRGPSDATIRKALLKSISTGPQSFEKFAAQVESDPELASVHDKLCGYIYHDVHLESFSGGCRDSYFESINQKAVLMMYRGRALNHCIQKTYPDHIRLSVHQYDNSGPKFSFSLSADTKKMAAPWHTVPVRLLNGKVVQLSHAIAKERTLAKVTCGQQNWLYMEVADPALASLSYEIIRAPKFGLRISDPQQRGYQHLCSDFLQNLSQDFGFLVLKDAPIGDQQGLVDFCEDYGEIYHWSFGPLNVIKPADDPKIIVGSTEKIPLHWDLNMLPHSDKNVQKNPSFAASVFMLYCKNPPAKGEGQTTVVDSRTALKLAGQQKVRQWKETSITYNTKKTYFGGDPRSYPLVSTHPLTGEDIFRYQEGTEVELQTLRLSSDTLDDEAFEALINEVNSLAYCEACLLKYEWEAGDLLIVDNYYTLHGRMEMSEKSMSRELWRVQVSH